MTIIIGIDPGSRRTGYGVIGIEGNHFRHITHGQIDTTDASHAERLQQIFLGLREIIATYQPLEAAMEEVFLHQNPNTALKLGQARGAAIVALALPLTEYSARQVKKSVVGHGGASKEQVQFMVQKLLNLNSIESLDASDALAVALTHATARRFAHLPVNFRRRRHRRLTFSESLAIIKRSQS